MDAKTFDRFSQTLSTASPRRALVSAVAAAALGAVALGQSAQPTAASTHKQCACKVKGARTSGLGQGICLLSAAANVDQGTRDACLGDATRCGDLASACKSADACLSDFFSKWAS